VSSNRELWEGSAVEENAGWIAGAVVIGVVFAIGAALWFMYHPM
jgi:hypothetical protein